MRRLSAVSVLVLLALLEMSSATYYPPLSDYYACPKLPGGNAGDAKVSGQNSFDGPRLASVFRDDPAQLSRDPGKGQGQNSYFQEPSTLLEAPLGGKVKSRYKKSDEGKPNPHHDAK